MPTRDGATTTERAVSAIAIAAVAWFCFTPRGRASIGRLERWLDEGERGASRLLDVAARAATFVGSAAEALRTTDPHPVEVTDFPSVVRRA